MRKYLLNILVISFVLFEPVITQAEEKNVQTITDALTGREVVYVMGGCFDMGDTLRVGYDDETPVHEVCVNDFYIAPKANELGIYDLTGNISEWCSDWYGEGYYSVSDKHNPKSLIQGSSKVFRGGSCHYQPRFPRTSLHFFRAPSYRYHYLGFRLARNGLGS